MIRRSLELAKLDPSSIGVRLRLAGGEVRPRFAPEPQPGDAVVDAGGIRVFVDARILESTPDAEIGVSGEHEQLVVRSGSAG